MICRSKYNRYARLAVALVLIDFFFLAAAHVSVNGPVLDLVHAHRRLALAVLIVGCFLSRPRGAPSLSGPTIRFLYETVVVLCFCVLVCGVERIALKQTFKSWTHLFSLPKYAQLNGCARWSFVRRRPFVVPSRPAINDADCARQSLRADASQNHDRLHALLDEIGPSSRALAARVGRSD